MIPPSERKTDPTSAELRSQAEAWKIAQHVLTHVAGVEVTKQVGSLAVMWDTVSILLALLRREAENRGVAWEKIEDRLNADGRDWLEVLKRGGVIGNDPTLQGE